MPWYSAQDSLDTLLVGRQIGLMHLVCYLRHGDRVFETYWTNYRGVEAMDYSFALMDLTVYGRQEQWEDSPPGWPVRPIANASERVRTNGRPIAQWSRLEAGRSDALTLSIEGRQQDEDTPCRIRAGVGGRARGDAREGEGAAART